MWTINVSILCVLSDDLLICSQQSQSTDFLLLNYSKIHGVCNRLVAAHLQGPENESDHPAWCN